MIVGRADRDHVGVDPRRVDGAAARPAVAGRRDHDQAAPPGELGRGRQRVEPVRARRRRAEREVDDTDVQLSPVGDHPLDPPHDRGDAAVAVPVQHPHVDQPRLGRDADELAGRARAVASQDSGHVRAVAARIRAPGCRAGEVGRRDDPTGRLDQVRVERDTGVEHRHGHAAPGQSIAPGRVGADLERVARGQPRRRDRPRIGHGQRAHQRVLVHVEHARRQADRLDSGRGRPAGRAVDDRQRADRPAEEPQQVVGLLGALEGGVGRERRARQVHLDDDRQQPGPVEHPRQQGRVDLRPQADLRVRHPRIERREGKEQEQRQRGQPASDAGRGTILHVGYLRVAGA